MSFSLHLEETNDNNEVLLAALDPNLNFKEREREREGNKEGHLKVPSNIFFIF